ncbi:SDR family NAD(P)-dependent oxidoreductase [Lentisalinibacter orientalis]|uniref:SDR family NAD(P)-dependent oxidoreductase n=1 Tax=Lentisalinibacter orientalis TaxID=2992241 RepID=UPI00386491AB
MDTATLLKIANFYGRFTPNYTKIGYYARGLPWGSSRPWDFSGQYWVVTGANAGIGKAIMHTAARAGAEVLAVARRPEKLRDAVAELPNDAAQRITEVTTDMSLQRETQKLLDRLISEGKKINVLMNNVGVLLNEHELTDEGREKSFVTNLLSHFQLTEGLLNAQLFADDATIVNMSSGGMYNVPLSIKGLNTLDPESYSGKVAYGFHKRAQVALTNYWNRKYGDHGLRCYVTHPGWSKTPGVKFSLPVFWKIQNVLLRSPLQGGDTALWLAAERPEIPPEEAIWFDRKPRETHIFEHTRNPLCTETELVDYLQRELEQEPAAAARPGA